jgi:hypothetical protein
MMYGTVVTSRVDLQRKQMESLQLTACPSPAYEDLKTFLATVLNIYHKNSPKVLSNAAISVILDEI